YSIYEQNDIPGSLVVEYGSIGGGPGDAKLFLNPNGNFGIGTTSPENALHVDGAINLDPTPAPGAPTTGFILYCDSADGKLKAKSSAGTVTVLADP
ncbi:unnamed protein product, partial [marine sediment metagenome]